MEEFQEFGDQFEVQDDDENHLVWLYEHEVDTLEPAELALFAFVQEEREKVSDSLLKWWGLSFCLSLIGIFGFAGVLFSVIIPLIMPFTSFEPLFPLWFALSILVLPTGISTFLVQRQIEITRKRGIDIKFALENDSFLSVLRKLAPLSDATSKISDSYSEKLHFVEEKLEGK